MILISDRKAFVQQTSLPESFRLKLICHKMVPIRWDKLPARRAPETHRSTSAMQLVCPPSASTMTLSSKVNLPHAINFRTVCGANFVTLPNKVGGQFCSGFLTLLGNVTKFASHTVLKLIARGKFTLDERVIVDA